MYAHTSDTISKLYDYFEDMRYPYLLLLFFFGQTAFSQSDSVAVDYSQTIPGTAVSFKMVAVPAGTFNMGAVMNDSKGEADEKPAHKVELSAFWIGAHEVTHDEYFQFFNDINFSQNIKTDAVTRPSSPYIDMTLGMGKEGGYPANSMQQYGALMYCKWLYHKTGLFYRLPTEAEWEYACRAGSAEVYPHGKDAAKLVDYAWYKANSNNKYQKVGLKKPNAWGIYDMLGNVSEWVLDQYDETFYQSETATAKDALRVPDARNPRLVRGGNYADDANGLRPSDRRPADPVWNRRDPQIPKSRWWNADAPFVGFRLVRPAKQPAPEEIETFFNTYLGK